MILMPQIFNVTANENARYKRNELELFISSIKLFINIQYASKSMKRDWIKKL